MRNNRTILSTSLFAGIITLGACSELPFHDSQSRHAIHDLPGQSEMRKIVPVGNGTGTATISIRQEDAPLCESQFYRDLHELTVEIFAVGATNVKVAEYEQQVFGLVRAADEFKGSAEAFIEHAKAIPAQLVDIIKEDPKVLDSCENLSIALVGPQ